MKQNQNQNNSLPVALVFSQYICLSDDVQSNNQNSCDAKLKYIATLVGPFTYSPHF